MLDGPVGNSAVLNGVFGGALYPAAAAFAFDNLELDELVAYTTLDNEPSRRVMQRIGMRHDAADDFDHPGLERGHPMRRHVLYRLGQADLLAA